MKIHIEKNYKELSEQFVSYLKLHKDLAVILDEESANALNKEIKQIIK